MPNAIYPGRKWTNYCMYGKDNRNSGARGMKSTPEICRRRDDHYLTNQYQPQQIQKTRKSICKIGTAKYCLSTNVRYIRKKITSKGLETGNILSYLSEDTLLTFYFFFIGRKQDWKLNFSRFCESQILSKFFLMGMIIPSSIAKLQNYICNFKSLDRKRNV